MAIAAMLFPGMIFCFTRHKLFGYKIENNFESIKNALFEYLCGTVFINVFILYLRYVLKQESRNIYENLNLYSVFAIKYLMCGILLAVIIPFIEKYCRERIQIIAQEKFKCKRKTSSKMYGVGIMYVIVLGMHHFVRLFDNSFWGDEGLTIVASRMSWDGMLQYVAQLGHSPFHYAVAWFSNVLFEESGFMYHLISALPYFVILIVSMTVVWKWYGVETMVVFTTLTTFLESAITYNLEVRMYAWCQMFVFLAFLVAYKLFETKRGRYFVLLTLFSLGAVYSHYFALASIGLIYVVLLFYYIKENWHKVWQVFLSGGSILVGFAPWIIYNYSVAGRVMSNYSMPEVEWRTCFEWVFYSRYSMALLLFFFFTLFVCFVYELGIVSFSRKNEITNIIVNLDITNLKFSAELMWILSGLCGVFGTIVISKIISSIVFPIIMHRYLYPAFIIIWLLLGVTISKCKLKKFFAVFIVVLVLSSCYPTYQYMVTNERANDERLAVTLEKTLPLMQENACIYTDIVHFSWTIRSVYYPNIPHVLFGQPSWGSELELPSLDSAKENWLFLGNPISETVMLNLQAQNKNVELVVDYGYIGTGNVWIYRVVEAIEE